VIVDSSALVAILRTEREAPEFSHAIESAAAQVSAATLVESSIILGAEMHANLDELVEAAGLLISPFDDEQYRVARTAYARYGKGSGSPARLNLGDCFSYALAKTTGLPLLFKGDDFTHTDVEPAYVP
jgi:ribonuclease VapC